MQNNSESVLPLDQQRPPALREDEAAAYSRLRDELATLRIQTGSYEGMGGITYDGTVVLEEAASRSDTDWSDPAFDQELGVTVRAGHISELVHTNALAEQEVIRGELEDLTRYNSTRGNGGFHRTQFGTIVWLGVGERLSTVERLPRLDGKILFPFNEAGQPYIPVDSAKKL